MFSGIGGFELGIQQAYELQQMGIKPKNSTDTASGTPQHSERPLCVGYSEIDKYAIQIYEKHFNHKNYGDITKINEKELPDFDLLVGGFPCQAFSIAGKRLGLDDTRGTLFYDIARIAKEKRPEHLLLENVKGLLSHDNGRTFKLIISTFAELGYDLEWQVLNSKNFGVPQNRERVFIIGHLGRCCRRQVFPFGANDGATIELPRQYTNTLTARYEGAAVGSYVAESELNAQEIGLEEITKNVSDAKRIYKSSGLAKTLTKGLGGGLGAKTGLYAIPVLTPDRLEKRQEGRRFKENGEPSFTLNTQDRHGVYDGMKIRRLTPVECERLQGHPDGWTEGVSDTQRYKTLGNGVTVNVVKHLIEKLYY